jgi:hypothetical protein
MEKFQISKDNTVIDIISLDDDNNKHPVFYPKRGTVDEFKKNEQYLLSHRDMEGFYFHYMIDKQLLGTCADRSTEKPVVPIEIGIKLNDDNYYVYKQSGYVYKYYYKEDKLKPLYITKTSNRGIDYYYINLNFDKK